MERLHLKVQPPQVTVLERNKKTEMCKRKIDQIFVRGEHVAYIVLTASDF